VSARRSPWGEPSIARSLFGLGERARSLRLARGWTLEEAAERADVDVRHVQLIETGNANPTAATLLRVARGYGVAVGALVDDPTPARGEARSDPRSEARDEPVRRVSPSMRAAASDDTLAQRVKSMRLARDWSQAELAIHAGISQGAVQAIEARAKSPTLRTLDAIAAAFGSTPYALLAPAPKARMPRARAGRR
jgi:transcriptional regulator with XRE-family HTH domain